MANEMVRRLVARPIGRTQGSTSRRQSKALSGWRTLALEIDPRNYPKIIVMVFRPRFDDARFRDLMCRTHERLKTSLQSLREVDELLNRLKQLPSQKPKKEKTTWLENQSFAAWGCSECAWIMPNLGRTPLGKASAAVREAFDKHECAKFPRHASLREKRPTP
jgi:hypothetical protein